MKKGAQEAGKWICCKNSNLCYSPIFNHTNYFGLHNVEEKLDCIFKNYELKSCICLNSLGKKLK